MTDDLENTIHGAKVVAARIQLTDLGIRAKQLTQDMRRIPMGTPGYAELEAEYTQLMRDVDDLEQKYFSHAPYVGQRWSAWQRALWWLTKKRT